MIFRLRHAVMCLVPMAATLCMGTACKRSPAESMVGGRIGVSVTENGFNPAQIGVGKGVPLTLEFRRTTDKTCATKVVFPEINLSRDLPLNETVAIEVPTDVARTLTFQCGMGMYKSAVTIQ